MCRDEVLTWLKNNVPPRRLTHILAVEKMCAELAPLYGLDTGRAATAGLLHDSAKFFPPPQLLAMAREDDIEIEAVLQKINLVL